MTEDELRARKTEWPEGAMVRFIGIDYDFSRKIPTGSIGKIQFVDDSGAVHIHWQTGFDKALVPNSDNFRLLWPDEPFEVF